MPGALTDFWESLKGGLSGDIHFGGSDGTTADVYVGQPRFPTWVLVVAIVVLVLLLFKGK